MAQQLVDIGYDHFGNSFHIDDILAMNTQYEIGLIVVRKIATTDSNGQLLYTDPMGYEDPEEPGFLHPYPTDYRSIPAYFSYNPKYIQPEVKVELPVENTHTQDYYREDYNGSQKLMGRQVFKVQGVRINRLGEPIANPGYYTINLRFVKTSMTIQDLIARGCI